MLPIDCVACQFPFVLFVSIRLVVDAVRLSTPNNPLGIIEMANIELCERSCENSL